MVAPLMERGGVNDNEEAVEDPYYIIESSH